MCVHFDHSRKIRKGGMSTSTKLVCSFFSFLLVFWSLKQPLQAQIFDKNYCRNTKLLTLFGK